MNFRQTIKYFVQKNIIPVFPGRVFWINRTFKMFFKRKINRTNPITFNEKLQLHKLFDKELERTNYAHKFEVRDFVKNTIGEKYLIPNIAHIFEPIERFNFKNLPSNIAIKATHGSGWIDIIKGNNSVVDWQDRIQTYKKWLKLNYYHFSYEPQYKNLKPSIIIEELLLTEDGKIPNDLKVHCFNGIPEFIHVATDRESNSGRAFYDKQWNRLDFQWSPINKKGEIYKNVSNNVEMPAKLLELLDISAKLAKNFNYVRVDFYECNDKLYFGELTFHPGSGFDLFFPEKWDYYYGEKFKLNNV